MYVGGSGSDLGLLLLSLAFSTGGGGCCGDWCCRRMRLGEEAVEGLGKRLAVAVPLPLFGLSNLLMWSLSFDAFAAGSHEVLGPTTSTTSFLGVEAVSWRSGCEVLFLYFMR